MTTGVPVSIWRNTDGFGEYSNTSANNIVDTASISLVDTAGIQIVDTGVTFTPTPASVWTENDAS